MTWNMNAVHQAEALKFGKNKSNTLARLVSLDEKERQARIEVQEEFKRENKRKVVK